MLKVKEYKTSLKEAWKEIEGYGGRYEVSNLGKVRSYFTGKPRIMTHVKAGNNYHSVSLSNSGEKKRYYIHRLVAYYFIGPPPKDRPFVLHKDDDRDNNMVSNLYYGTPAMNLKDAIHNDRMCTVLTKEEAREIKHSRADEDITKLSKEYGVSYGVVYNILNEISWRWV